MEHGLKCDKEPSPDTQFKRHLKEREDLPVATKNKYLASARIFFRELKRKWLIPFDITLNIKGFKLGKKHKREDLTKEEMKNFEIE